MDYAMTQPPPKRRVRLDSQGRPIREIENPLGEYTPDIDAVKVNRLGGNALKLAETAKNCRPSFNPYQGNVAAGKPTKERSKLDYMRELSEEIKRRRKGKPDD
ncbi:MAG: hypothetical protein ABI859_16485 [Pseudomonadota bacterium]